jgi:F-type H+-transporting ATPase subunit delta
LIQATLLRSGLVSSVLCFLPSYTCCGRAVSGGFATVHPNNKLTINAVEAAPLEHFSLDVSILPFLRKLNSFWMQAIKANLSEALKVAAGNGSEEDKLGGRIEADVYEALQTAISSR